MKIILGSKSPRRSEILALAGIEFSVDVIEVDENIAIYKTPNDLVKKISMKKIKAYQKKYPDDIVICADTIVVVDDIVLGKPHSKEEAYEMIKLINGRSHNVLTSVSIGYNNKIKNFVEKTKVVVDYMSKDEIDQYIATSEPYDKAGAYAIQGAFSKYIVKIDGDYYNVMGMPINHLHRELKKINKKETNN